mmetsp:Transcript_34361/g.53613  ORF Transcript_34361/g.53613 Transcript_34361/m.53613 type:complete len:129 (+) Transcript_34361:325-711(+)
MGGSEANRGAGGHHAQATSSSAGEEGSRAEREESRSILYASDVRVLIEISIRSLSSNLGVRAKELFVQVLSAAASTLDLTLDQELRIQVRDALSTLVDSTDQDPAVREAAEKELSDKIDLFDPFVGKE